MSAALLVALPSVEASARCIGSTHARSTLVSSNGVSVLEEKPVSGSCNGNNIYQGMYHDDVYGWEGSVWIKTSSSSGWRKFCCSYDEDGWRKYSYTDTNSYSHMVLCHRKWDEVYCGWGSKRKHSSAGRYYFDYYGVNRGY
jgi:hypothetical protein